MGFVLTEEQQMLRDAALAFTAERTPVKQLRALRDAAGAEGFDPVTWREMAEMGWAGVIIPESHGGAGLGHVGLGQILEAQGRTLAATPLLQTALVGASALLLAGSEAQKSELLPRIAAGALRTALAVDEGPHHAPNRVGLTARRETDGWVLDGAKAYVVDGGSADLLIVSARTSGGPEDAGGVTLFLVPGDAAGLSRTSLRTLDAHAAANIRLSGVRVGDGARLGPDGQGLAVLEQILDRARIGLAAEMLGAADAAFEMTVDYLKVRKQFGQLIGSFQALQHRAAAMFTELELTRSAVAAALDAIDRNANDLAEYASLAKARAAETLHLVSNETVQMHGGIGMTDAHDSGLYMKRARVLEALYGGEAYHRDRYAALNGF